jgi:signal transduction histidine kinase
MSKILVVEDEINIRETIVDILEANDYEVIEAPNGMVGLIKTVKEKPDLVICDINIPELNGFEMLEGLKECMEERLIPPLIFLTAKVERSDMRKGMNLGADDYITKPFQASEVLESIKSKLEKRLNVKDKIISHERLKVSRYLHDSIQNLLLGSFLGFRSLSNNISSLDAQNQTIFKSAFGMLDQAIIDLRDYSHNISSNDLIDNIDLKLHELVGSIKEISKVDLTLTCSVTKEIPSEIQTHLYNIVQEAVSNILKHANARKAQIILQCNEKGIRLEIIDDGNGYDTSKKNGGIGIPDLMKKATAISAELKIHSELGKGTQVLLEQAYFK